MQNMCESAGATRIEKDTPGAVAVPAEPVPGAMTPSQGAAPAAEPR